VRYCVVCKRQYNHDRYHRMRAVARGIVVPEGLAEEED
jgi:predicted RNA-binding protein YlxR (DUF448 family)